MNQILREMLKAGVQIGRSTKDWNPKMAPYIYEERNGVHILNLLSTMSYLMACLKFLKQVSSEGQQILFVCTNPNISPLIQKVAIKSDSFYVNQKWLGGMLTNWQTIQSSIKKLLKLERAEFRGELSRLTKKEAVLSRKQKQRLDMYLGGIKYMRSLPDVVIIIGQTKEMNAVLECQKLGIRTITILGTDGDCSLTDMFIPANDNSEASLLFLLNQFLIAILAGQEEYNNKLATSNSTRLRKQGKKKVKASTTLNKPKNRLTHIKPV